MIVWRRSNEDPVSAVIGFWKEAGSRGQWFKKDPAFDTAFRELFVDVHMQVAARQHDAWNATAEGSLVLVILTDQFPRNAFRGTAHMYATDPLARLYARQAHEAGHMAQVDPELRLFFCLPFAHSEDIADQDVSVRLNSRLGEPWLSHAEGHRNIIRRFGRFPHRNFMLGREMTQAETHFLNTGGFRG